MMKKKKREVSYEAKYKKINADSSDDGIYLRCNYDD